MTTDDNIIVAIELGSSKVTGIAGCKQPDGGIQILALAQEPSATFIRKGLVYNLDKTRQCLANIREKLSKALNKPIRQVYVGIAGQGITTARNTVLRQLESQTSITHEIVDSLLDNNLNTHPGEREVLDVIPQEYKVGTQLQVDPIGVLTDSIEGRFLNITASPSLRENIDKCFAQAGIEIADRPISALALAACMLSETERRSGCVLVDMGADTTTVSIYKSNILRQLSVIPLGGNNVTKDIMSLQVEQEEAEQLKRTYGTAYAEVDEDKATGTISLSENRSVDEITFYEIVEARLEEIIVNVANQIKMSGYTKEQLLAGIIITGGVAATKNLERAFREHTGFDKFRFAKSVSMTVRLPQGFENVGKYGNLNTAIALLDKGEENCCGEIAESKPATTLFSNDEHAGNHNSEAERARKAAEEAEAKAREEQERLEAEEREREAEEKKRRKEEKRARVKAKFGRFWQRLSSVVSEEDEFPDEKETDKKK